MKRAIVIIGIIMLAGPACAGSGKLKPLGTKPPTANKPGKATTNFDYSYLEVMHDQADQLARIEFGIFTKNRYMIERGARVLVEKPQARKRPRTTLKSFDKLNRGSGQMFSELIRSSANELVQAAPKASMLELLEIKNSIAMACVRCHDRSN